MKLLEIIEREAEEKCRDIARQVDEEIRLLEEKTGQRIEAARLETREKTKRQIRSQEAVVLSKAEIEIQKAETAAKQEILERALQSARDKISQVVASPEYAAVFRSLAEEATSEVKDKVVVSVRPEDRSLAEETLGSLGAGDCELREDSSILGGLTVETHDGRIRVVNTLNARFDRVVEESIVEIGRVLFGG